MPSHADHQIAVRPATLDDVIPVTAIYNHFVDHTVVTFEEERVTPVEFGKRMHAVWSASLPFLVAEQGGAVVGYAYASKWKERSGYRFSVEASVYLAPDAGGRGIGSSLYGTLFPMLEAKGVHAVMGGIALPNDASVALHEKFGMRKVAHFEETGFKFDRWIDVGYWERIFPQKT